MSENIFESPASDVEEEINTYTDHPAYQDPIARSDFHNRIRTTCGWMVMVSSVVAAIFSTLLSVYLIYKSGAGLIEGFENKYIAISSITKTSAAVVSIWIALRFRQWGRHLTRPTSREWI